MKSFNDWNKLKKKLNNKKINLNLRVGEIWICNLGLNVGHETNGKNKDFIRPVIIIKTYKNSGAITLPLTTKQKNDFFHFKLSKNSYIKLTQIKFLDQKRFKRKIKQVNKFQIKNIREKLFKVI